MREAWKSSEYDKKKEKLISFMLGNLHMTTTTTTTGNFIINRKLYYAKCRYFHRLLAYYSGLLGVEEWLSANRIAYNAIDSFIYLSQTFKRRNQY